MKALLIAIAIIVVVPFLAFLISKAQMLGWLQALETHTVRRNQKREEIENVNDKEIKKEIE